MLEPCPGLQTLSDITVHSSYARYRQEEQRRENWEEITYRLQDMHLRRHPNFATHIAWAMDLVREKRIVPSMRSMQFGGKAIELNEARIYNCSYLPINDVRAFREIMFLLLGGTGVGYSVQSQHVNQLPRIRGVVGSKRYVISDDIIGWSNAVHALVGSYFNGTELPRFIYDDIRPRGTQLKTAGGKAPGPDGLREALEQIQEILATKTPGSRLTSLECHDIACLIASAVLSGGIRRSAMISLFDIDDQAMLYAKMGEFPTYRGFANNSAVVVRHMVTKQDFDRLTSVIAQSGFGEPGILFTNNSNYGTNPCGEIGLKPNQFCNTTSINGGANHNQAEFEEAARAAAFLGTLQASYTDFHYLRPEWKWQTEREALLGVSITGLLSGDLGRFDYSAAAQHVLRTNEIWANALGINMAARTTTIKPEGTCSAVLKTSSGCHAWKFPFFIRRVRQPHDSALMTFFRQHAPSLMEEVDSGNKNNSIICLPCRAPEGATTEDQLSAIDQFDIATKLAQDWIIPGHRKGENRHNVSITVNVRDGEWGETWDTLWERRNILNGVSFLPVGHKYKQAPFEEISEQQYREMLPALDAINLGNLKETEDGTNLTGELACVGGACEI